MTIDLCSNAPDCPDCGAPLSMIDAVPAPFVKGLPRTLRLAFVYECRVQGRFVQVVGAPLHRMPASIPASRRDGPMF